MIYAIRLAPLVSESDICGFPRLGSIGNQFAITSVLSFLVSVPLMIAREGSRFPEFMNLFMTNPVLRCPLSQMHMAQSWNQTYL